MRSAILKSLMSPTTSQTLAVLVGHPETMFYQRELATQVGLPLRAVQRVLVRLQEADIVTANHRGNRVYYQINTGCPIFPELRQLILKTVGLGDVLREALAEVPGVEAAFVYGSLARDEGTAGSDVDLIVVGEVTLQQLMDRLHQVQDTLSREINPTVYPLSEFRQKITERQHFLTRVMESPKLFVIGDADALSRLAGPGLGDGAPHQPEGDRRTAGRRRSRPPAVPGRRS